MRLDPSLAALGVDAAAAGEAWSAGHIVGRGEGFVSKEWRERPDAASLVICVHAGADEVPVAAQPFVAGLGWTLATLGPVRESPTDPHDVTLRLGFGGDAFLDARVPDAAARRKLFPAGFEAQVSVLLLPALPDGQAPEDTVEVKGAVLESRALTLRGAAWTASKLSYGTGALWVLDRGEAPVSSGERSARGRVWVRVGASSRGRTGTSRA